MYGWLHTVHVQTARNEFCSRWGSTLLTSVRKDVLPEPLGPIRSIDGRVVKLLARKTKKCRKSGIVRTKTILIASPRGDGLRSELAISVPRDMMRGSLCMRKLQSYNRIIMHIILDVHVCMLGAWRAWVTRSGIHFASTLPCSGNYHTYVQYSTVHLGGVAYAQPRNCIDERS